MDIFLALPLAECRCFGDMGSRRWTNEPVGDGIEEEVVGGAGHETKEVRMCR